MPEGAEVGGKFKSMTVAELVHRLCEFPLDTMVGVLFDMVDDEGLHWDTGYHITDLVYHKEDGWVGIVHTLSFDVEEEAEGD